MILSHSITASLTARKPPGSRRGSASPVVVVPEGVQTVRLCPESLVSCLLFMASQRFVGPLAAMDFDGQGRSSWYLLTVAFVILLPAYTRGALQACPPEVGKRFGSHSVSNPW